MAAKQRSSAIADLRTPRQPRKRASTDAIRASGISGKQADFESREDDDHVGIESVNTSFEMGTRTTGGAQWTAYSKIESELDAAAVASLGMLHLRWAKAFYGGWLLFSCKHRRCAECLVLEDYETRSPRE